MNGRIALVAALGLIALAGCADDNDEGRPAVDGPVEDRLPMASTTTPATSSPDGTTTYYANCDAVRAAGQAPLGRDDPGYRAGLDRDGDGVACDTEG